MSNPTLQATTRTEIGHSVEQVRQEGMIPCVVYGGKQNYNLKVPKIPFDKLYRQAGESTLVDLIIDEKTTLPVLIHEFQRHPVTSEFDHIDFYEVDMKKEIITNIELHFIGEPPAVKEMGGTLVKNINDIEIKCLPGDLIHSVEVSLASLNNFDDSIHVKDLPVPANIKVLTPGDMLVAKVVEQEVEAEVAVVSEAEAVQAVGASVEKGKKVEEGEEGAAAPAKEVKK